MRFLKPLLFAALVLTAQVAHAAEPEGVPELRREVAELRREIADLRREIYGLRLDVMSAVKNGGGGGGSARLDPPPAPGLPDEDPPTKGGGGDESGTGKVSGTVKLASGDAPAFVYVDNVPRKSVKKNVEIRQVRRQFEPRFAVVQLGTKITFPNQDSMFHNVFSPSPGNTFDLGIYRSGDEPKSYTMTSPGVVDVFCNMHSEMSASVLVVPSPLYAKVGADGRFTLEGVPAGSRKLVAWSPGHSVSTQTVTVKGGKDASVSFSLGEAAKTHTNKHGQPYGSYK
jgi:plastocyanin